MRIPLHLQKGSECGWAGLIYIYTYICCEGLNGSEWDAVNVIRVVWRRLIWMHCTIRINPSPVDRWQSRQYTPYFIFTIYNQNTKRLYSIGCCAFAFAAPPRLRIARDISIVLAYTWKCTLSPFTICHCMVVSLSFHYVKHKHTMRFAIAIAVYTWYPYTCALHTHSILLYMDGATRHVALFTTHNPKYGRLYCRSIATDELRSKQRKQCPECELARYARTCPYVYTPSFSIQIICHMMEVMIW